MKLFPMRRAQVYFIVAVLFLLAPYFSGCGGSGSGVSMETFPGSNVRPDGTIDWNKAFTAKDQTVTSQCFGGYYSDVGYCIRPTHDGGFIVAGTSSSTDGDLQTSGNHGGGDVWVIKFSSGGNIEWQKCYGGSDFDCAYSIQESKVGSSTYDGYVFAGVTRSHDGDVQSRKDKTATDNDMWIAKIDTQGALIWEKFINGGGSESIRSVCQADDGCYVIAAGYNGEAYVAKFENTGSQGNPPNLKWTKIIGGSGVDWAGSIQQTSDGGYIFAGYTSSTSGTGISGNHGGYDALVVKLVEDETGSGANIEWSRCLGGSSGDRAYSIQQTSDGGYVVGGETKSYDGDINGNNPSGYDCCWVVKLDSTGNNIEWQKCINNGLLGCYSGVAQQTSDGGYVVTGNIYASGYTYNCYVAKLDGTGNLVWAKSQGGSGPDYGYSVCDIAGTCLAVGETYSSTSTGYHDGGDVFLVKIAEQGPPPTQSLTINNAKATPEEFTPPDQTTTITADIIATNFTPTNLKCNLVIKDKNAATIRTFPTTNSQSVSVAWDGKNDAKDVVDFGEYTFNISASCNEVPGPATATGKIKTVPPFPTLKELTFDNTINIADDDGRALKPTYYQVTSQDTVQNPIAMALSDLTAGTAASTSVSTDKSQSKAIIPFTAKCSITLNLDKFPAQLSSATYEIRIKSVEGDFVFVEKAYVTFNKAGKSTTNNIDFKVLGKVQTIKKVKIDYRLVKDATSGTPESDWVEDSIAKPTEPIWVTISDPVEPIGIHGKDKVRTGLLDISCYIADGATTPEEARIKMVPNLYNWLKGKEFIYDGYTTSSEVLYGDKKNPAVPTGAAFDYTKFMSLLPQEEQPLPPDPFVGDCRDVSNLYSLCCAALGFKMNLNLICRTDDPIHLTYMTTLAFPCGGYDIPISLEFHFHQVAALDDPYLVDFNMLGTAYDPLIKYVNAPWPDNLAASVKPNDYRLYTVDTSYLNTVDWWSKHPFSLTHVVPFNGNNF